jgi:hypothetical protein
MAQRAASAKVNPAGLFCDQVKRGPDQRLAQIAVVISAEAIAVPMSRPAHVKGF